MADHYDRILNEIAAGERLADEFPISCPPGEQCSKCTTTLFPLIEDPETKDLICSECLKSSEFSGHRESLERAKKLNFNETGLCKNCRRIERLCNCGEFAPQD